MKFKVTIQHESFGVILEESFIDSVQFKLFLKTISASLELKNDLTFFNGVDYFLHVPHKHLVNSIINTKLEPTTLTEQISKKSKIES